MEDFTEEHSVRDLFRTHGNIAKSRAGCSRQGLFIITARASHHDESARSEHSQARSLHSCTGRHEKLLFARGSRRRSADFVPCNPTTTITWCGRRGRASRFSGTASQRRTQKWCPSLVNSCNATYAGPDWKARGRSPQQLHELLQTENWRKAPKPRFERLKLRKIKPDATLTMNGRASCRIPVPCDAHETLPNHPFQHRHITDTNTWRQNVKMEDTKKTDEYNGNNW